MRKIIDFYNKDISVPTVNIQFHVRMQKQFLAPEAKNSTGLISK
jgi:hypothetical protein